MILFLASDGSRGTWEAYKELSSSDGLGFIWFGILSFTSLAFAYYAGCARLWAQKAELGRNAAPAATALS